MGKLFNSHSLTTDANGERVAESRYLPYGQERWSAGAAVTDFAFTGQRSEGYIKHYREHRAITLRAKIVTLVILWSVIGYTAWGVVTAWWLRAVLGAVAVGVTLHLLHLKTLTREMVTQLETATETE